MRAMGTDGVERCIRWRQVDLTCSLRTVRSQNCRWVDLQQVFITVKAAPYQPFPIWSAVADGPAPCCDGAGPPWSADRDDPNPLSIQPGDQPVCDRSVEPGVKQASPAPRPGLFDQQQP
jgi:hypothetical protein